MYKILILDDEIENLQIIFDIIRKSGENYQILRALDAYSALAITEKEMPDLIITDWEMPEMNGIEFIKTLKKNLVLKNIPVIMCTGIMTNSENLKTALDAGAVDYIRKPIDDIELLSRIKATIRLVHSLDKAKEKETQVLLEKNEEISNKLDQQNRKLTTYALLLAQKNKETIQIIEEIREIFDESKIQKVKTSIRELIVKLHNSNTENTWEYFKKHFEEVHPDFLSNLQEKYPLLTQNDLKMCSFLRLNMNTKEIAKMASLSPKSVDVARHRIRKKLNLKKNDNLFNILSKI